MYEIFQRNLDRIPWGTTLVESPGRTYGSKGNHRTDLY